MRNCCFRGSGRDSRRTENAPPPGFGRDRYDRRDRYGRCDRRDGLLTGGPRWLAGWLGLPTWVVVAFFVVLFLTVGWPALLIYLACALLLRHEPEPGPATRDVPGIRLDEQARDIRDRARDLDARIARMESHVTSKEFDFDRRLGAAGPRGR